MYTTEYLRWTRSYESQAQDTTPVQIKHHPSVLPLLAPLVPSCCRHALKAAHNVLFERRPSTRKFDRARQNKAKEAPNLRMVVALAYLDMGPAPPSCK